LRTVPTSGGIELGPEKGPWVDVVPLARPAPRGHDLLVLADQLVREGSDWRPWDSHLERGPSAPPELVGVAGVLPGEEQPQVLVLFRWWASDSPQSALRRIEEAEGELPIALAAACLAAARAERAPGPAPTLLAEAAGSFVVVDPAAATVSPDDLARACIAAAASGREPPAARTATEAARAVLRASRLLWHEEEAKAARAAYAPGARWDILERTAAAGAICWGIERAAGPFGSMAVPAGHEAPAWTAFAEAVGTGIQRPAWRHLTGDGDIVLDPGVWPRGGGLEEAACLGLAAALLQEARERARYVVQGGLVLLPPRDAAAVLGVRRLFLWAEREATWAAIETGAGRTPPFLWARDITSLGPVVPPHARPLVHVLLAAAWRDLTVAGEEATPRRRREREKGDREPAHTASPRSPRPRSLPARPRPAVTGERVWARARERRIIRQQAALVRGHLRRLPEGCSPSPRAREGARDYGIILPGGHTFVRPHARGGQGTGVTAGGLASLLAIVPARRRRQNDTAVQEEL